MELSVLVSGVHTHHPIRSRHMAWSWTAPYRVQPSERKGISWENLLVYIQLSPEYNILLHGYWEWDPAPGAGVSPARRLCILNSLAPRPSARPDGLASPSSLIAQPWYHGCRLGIHTDTPPLSSLALSQSFISTCFGARSATVEPASSRRMWSDRVVHPVGPRVRGGLPVLPSLSPLSPCRSVSLPPHAAAPHTGGYSSGLRAAESASVSGCDIDSELDAISIPPSELAPTFTLPFREAALGFLCTICTVPAPPASSPLRLLTPYPLGSRL